MHRFQMVTVCLSCGFTMLAAKQPQQNVDEKMCLDDEPMCRVEESGAVAGEAEQRALVKQFIQREMRHGTGSLNDCRRAYQDAANNVISCLADSKLGEESFKRYAEFYHSITTTEYLSLGAKLAEGEALSSIAGQCDPIKDLGIDSETVGLINLSAERAGKLLVQLYIEILEDPRTKVYIQEHFGDKVLADTFEVAREKFGKICKTDGKNATLLEEDLECQKHIELHAFLDLNDDNVGGQLCSSVQASLIQQHTRKRKERNHRRAQFVQVLHSDTNKIGNHFAGFLRHGGSERQMDALISHAVVGTGLTDRQQQLLRHIEESLHRERFTEICSSWSSQTEAENLPKAISNSVLMQSRVYRSYMDCVCKSDELNLVCQSEFLQNSAELSADMEKRYHQLLSQAPERQAKHGVATTEVDATDKSNVVTALPVGPCLHSAAFSCEVCLGTSCLHKTEHKDSWGLIKDALKEKPTSFNISCTACAAIQPGEQMTFEAELSLSTNFQNMDSMFSETKVEVAAKACIGSGSPMRVVYDTLGIDNCPYGLEAVYLPFLGDLSVAGAIPGPIKGTKVAATFDSPVHDPPDAVRFHCNAQSDSNCYEDYKSKAGPLFFSAVATVPLLVADDYEIVKVSGPHNTGAQWQVELFQMPINIPPEIKQFWDDHAGPVIDKAVETIKDGVAKAGDWAGDKVDNAVDGAKQVMSNIGDAIANRRRRRLL